MNKNEKELLKELLKRDWVIAKAMLDNIKQMTKTLGEGDSMEFLVDNFVDEVELYLEVGRQ